MTHNHYMKRLAELANELQAAGNARPYDPHLYNRLVNELNTIHAARYRELNSSVVRRFFRWAGKRIFAALCRMKQIIRKEVSP